MKKLIVAFALCAGILMSKEANAEQMNCNMAKAPNGGFVLTCVPAPSQPSK